MPIINVQNNETLFKQCKEELDETKRKNERLMNEKNELKLLNNQLENKVNTKMQLHTHLKLLLLSLSISNINNVCSIFKTESFFINIANELANRIC